MAVTATKFSQVYDSFFSKITDDMYMELDKAQTHAMTCELLQSAIPWFEFPRVNLYYYNLEQETFNIALSLEEINILSVYMVVEWIKQQLATIELIRQKYSGADFKFTSQANHIAKLITLKQEFEREGFHLQRLYKRRKTSANGQIVSTLSEIMGKKIADYAVAAPPLPEKPADTPSEDNKWEDLDPIPVVPDDDDSWEDMEDLPPDSMENVTPGGSQDDSWEDMEDIVPSNWDETNTTNS